MRILEEHPGYVRMEVETVKMHLVAAAAIATK